jgi:di/tricarboxylate transporter
LVQGRLDRLEELRGWRELVFEDRELGAEKIVSDEVHMAELSIPEGSPFVGASLGRTDFRRQLGVIVLALRRGDSLTHTGLADRPLESGDRLLVQGRLERLEALSHDPELDVIETGSAQELAHSYRLDHRIFLMRVPEDSVLVGRSLAESRLGDVLGLGAVGIVRDGRTRLLPESDERLVAGDGLLMRGDEDALEVFHGLQQLETDEQAPPPIEMLETVRTGLAEVILSPRTTLAGSTLRRLDFRERYGVHVLAIFREGRALRSNLRDVPLRFGDALLLFGRHQKLQLVSTDPEFVVLTRTAEAVGSRRKAAVSALILLLALLPVLLGWLPIAVAAVAGAALMLLTRCLDVDEAYRVIEWRSVFLIAGMLPLGTAMQQTGAAAFLADGALSVTGPLGPWGVIAGLYLVTALATTIIPTAALVVLMAPIALKASGDLGISPHAVMMAVAVAASASFTSPIAHPANVLVMGPGGYRFVDYVKLGAPLALVVFIVTMLVMPFFWPLH